MLRHLPIACILIAGIVLSGCAPAPDTGRTKLAIDPANFEKDLITHLVEAKPGDVITLPAGEFALSRGLTLNTDGVTLRGAGMDTTQLSFANQIQGAEGLLVNANDFTIEDLALLDAKGDALKINEGRNITIRRVRTEWTAGPATDNGAYGIYPVQCENVLVEDSIAIGASDAGIYVGQSRHIIVRGNRAEYNVAGIEIENSVHADVHDNVATDNTGGILVFNMPNLPEVGHSTRVFDNIISNNNTPNFAPPGTAVSTVLAGSGVVINANDRVEVFNNLIQDNQTANIMIVSYFATSFGDDRSVADSFDPWPEQIHIHGNTFGGGGTAPTGQLGELQTALVGQGNPLPDVVWDGAVNPQRLINGEPEADARICVDNGDAKVLDLDLINEFAAPAIADHRCSHDPLPSIVLAGME